MEKPRSPLLIPQARGRTFRIVVSTAFIAGATWAIIQLVEAVQSGTLDWATRYGSFRIDRANQPDKFWSYVAGLFVGCVCFLYASFAEIVYAIRWYRADI